MQEDEEDLGLIQEISEWDKDLIPGQFNARDGFLIAFASVVIAGLVVAIIQING